MGIQQISTDHALERRLRDALQGEVRFDAFTRGRYATDASIYQIIPMGVVFPHDTHDLAATLAICKESGVPVILRGGGTSQNGQPIGSGIVVDMARHCNALLAIDEEAGTADVLPGLVLERLNTALRPKGLFFPVEPSTATRCTLGGMAGNNSSGARSMFYGKMVDNVLGIDALLADGSSVRLSSDGDLPPPVMATLAIAEREREEIITRYPKVQRRVGGYNLDALIAPTANPAHLLVGSEGTLAAFTRLRLKLARLPAHRVMGVCHFPNFRAAMETTQHIVALKPVAVELVDQNVLQLGADIPLFVRTLSQITRGTPDCLLLVEFAGDDRAELMRDLKRLDLCMGDYGFPDAVVEVTDAAAQRQVWEVREACLNIMMSMKGDAKPVSFIEDCAVPLDRLADYTGAVTEIFHRHGTRGTWYAHASVGCLHVRPILNMKTAEGVANMRAIADETAELVRRFEGSYSGEHGDGISRSDYIEPLFGARLTRAFEEVKDAFDPENRLNPAKIVRAHHMDDRSLMRYPPGYRAAMPGGEALDWSAFGSLPAAVEMCNNNGTCRKLAGGAMCPSYRVTRDEQHVTRGRANSLRLALSGQLGPDALTSAAMMDTMKLCVGCKACQRECPTGVDMARMKTEVLHHYYHHHRLPVKERLIAYLPRYARYARWAAPLLNLRNHFSLLRWAGERLLGFSMARSLPAWALPQADAGAPANPTDIVGDGRDIVLFEDTFSHSFEPHLLAAARMVLERAGYRLHHARAADPRQSLCCGRTFLSCGQVDEARAEARRTAEVLLPLIAKGARIVGVEPSCLLTLRDEFAALLPAEEAQTIATATQLIEEALVTDSGKDWFALRLAPASGRIAHLHGHCHQKAAGAMGAVEQALRLIPGLDVRVIESSCCGMAGAFGYDAKTYDISRQMGELSLAPAVRAAADDDLIVADGTSCRHQIDDLTGRKARHVAEVLADFLGPAH